MTRDELIAAYNSGRRDFLCANLSHINLSGVNLSGSNLIGVNPRGAANLSYANLSYANLSYANLSYVNLIDAELRGANLIGANLISANLSEADLRGADLSGAITPDGRKWEDYYREHMAGICDDPEVREWAVAAWGEYTWAGCPMHAAYGWRDFRDIPPEHCIAVGFWIACYDAELLERPQ